MGSAEGQARLAGSAGAGRWYCRRIGSRLLHGGPCEDPKAVAAELLPGRDRFHWPESESESESDQGLCLCLCPYRADQIRSAREQATCRLAEPRPARRGVNEASQGLHQIGGRGRSAQLLTDQHTGHRPELLAQERLELSKEFR